MSSILTFFHLQLDRILGKTQVHAPGPKKPTLGQQDLGKVK
jgi:hypothetical protein